MATTVSKQPIFIDPQTVQIGDSTIPLGKITTSYILSRENVEIPVVRIHTEGGMDLGGKDVILDFEFETIAKTHRFFHDLLAQGRASFNLSAYSMSPIIVRKKETVQGMIDIKFGQKGNCESFHDSVAPVFFSRFKKLILNDKTVQLTLPEMEELNAIELMNNALEELNQKTHHAVSSLLERNNDRRFHASKSQEPLRAAPPRRDPHYFVDSVGGVKKEKAIVGRAPAGHFLMWDERPDFYHAPMPLEQPSEVTKAETLDQLGQGLEFGEALCQHSEAIAKKIGHEVKRVKDEFENKTRRTALQWELLINFVASPKVGLSPEDMEIVDQVATKLENDKKQP